MNEEWYVRSETGEVYGPATKEALIAWAKEGRISPVGFVSQDRKEWMPAQLMPELEMKWVVESEPGKFFGPFHRQVVISLAQSGQIPEGANVYRRHDLAVDEDPAPVIVEKIVEVEKIIEVEPSPRTAISEDASVTANEPPPPMLNGIFNGFDRARLEALEAAARRELIAAKGGKLAGMFGRKPL